MLSVASRTLSPPPEGTDEVLELVAERLDFLGGGSFADRSHTVVQELCHGRVALEQLSIPHRSFTPLCSVMGTAR